jgi:hypothetical protein
MRQSAASRARRCSRSCSDQRRRCSAQKTAEFSGSGSTALNQGTLRRFVVQVTLAAAAGELICSAAQKGGVR